MIDVISFWTLYGLFAYIIFLLPVLAVGFGLALWADHVTDDDFQLFKSLQCKWSKVVGIDEHNDSGQFAAVTIGAIATVFSFIYVIKPDNDVNTYHELITLLAEFCMSIGVYVAIVAVMLFSSVYLKKIYLKGREFKRNIDKVVK